jgi:hypothetical protein
LKTRPSYYILRDEWCYLCRLRAGEPGEIQDGLEDVIVGGSKVAVVVADQVSFCDRCKIFANNAERCPQTLYRWLEINF